MYIVEQYLTRKTLFHLALALPALILLIVYGRSLNDQWWFYTLLYVLNICSLILNAACIVVAPIPKYRRLYAILRMLSHLLFIPAFCCLMLSVFFTTLLLFGVDFNPAN